MVILASYRSLYFLKLEIFTNCDRKIKYSWEKLEVAISQHLGALSDSKYIADVTFKFKDSTPNI